MKAYQQVMLSLCLLATSALHAGSKTITCEEPQGARVDYFLKNPAKVKNETFMFGRDKIDGLKLIIVLDDNNKDVHFSFHNTAATTAVTTEENNQDGKMSVIFANDDQVTFVGTVSGAPIMATYYPGFKILVYSQQSSWPGGNFLGARAMMFYSKCGEAVVAPN